MILTSLFLVVSAFAEPKVEWSAPAAYIAGDAFKVELSITAGEGGSKVESWMLTAAAFEIDGNALGERKGQPIDLPAGFTLSGVIDLGPQIKSAGGFKLTHASGQGEAVNVSLMEPAPENLNFMDETAMPTAELAKYKVLLRTNRGDILLEMWPEIAPKHVRNFLDLAYIKFYDGSTFHRVMPGFMIQGGDKNRGDGTGSGPRTVPAEFQRERKHVRGVLSAARSPDPNSASCQFFIMHDANAGLDGSYSAFGKALYGLEVVDKIVNAPGRPIPGSTGTRPDSPQLIERAIVVKAKS